MVLLGDIIVGGKDVANFKEYMSGIVFELSAETNRKKSYIFDNWEVEISESNTIVARTKYSYSRDKTHELGYAVCEKALDLYFAEGFGAYSITEPNYKYIDLIFENGGYSLCIHDIYTILMGTFVDYAFIDKDGNITPSAPVPQPSWEFIYRYYRFAKTSSNMYDAYRWMYLVFEILMQNIAPIQLKSSGKPAEGERSWIDRALRTADDTFKWSTKVNWSTSDYIEYFLSNQYDNIRCNLFHSKGERILPNDQLGKHIVHKMLLELEDLCIYLMDNLYPITNNRGGVTYHGFESFMKGLLEDTTAFISSLSYDIHSKAGKAVLINPLLLLKADSVASSIKPYFYARTYSTTLSHDKEYYIKSYGINKGSDIIGTGNIKKINLFISELSKLTIVIQNRMINRVGSKYYL